MIYQAIRNILQNDSTFAAAIGTDSDGTVKVYSIFPTKKVSPPFTTVTLDDQEGNPTKGSVSAIDIARVSVKTHDYSLEDIDTIVGYARTALDNQKSGGLFDTVQLASIDFERFRDGFVQIQGTGEILQYRELIYEIWIEP